jgi:hypothetical protein
MASKPHVAVDDACVLPRLWFPDPNNRHVLAGAIAGNAFLIVTYNLKDFPTADLKPYGIACISPKTRFADSLVASVKRARQNLRRSIPTADAFVDALERQGPKTFSAILRRESGERI